MLPDNLTITHRKPVEWDTVFLNMAFAIAEKSKDNSTQCGAILVDNNNVIISTGFNGPPRQLEDAKVPWNIRPEKYAFIIHAEENALWYGTEAKGALIQSKMYCTHHPCTECTIRLIRAGVREIVIPACHSEYKLSAYHKVKPEEVIETQVFPKLNIRVIQYAR